MPWWIGECRLSVEEKSSPGFWACYFYCPATFGFRSILCRQPARTPVVIFIPGCPAETAVLVIFIGGGRYEILVFLERNTAGVVP